MNRRLFLYALAGITLFPALSLAEQDPNYRLIRAHIEEFSKDFITAVLKISKRHQRAKDALGLEELTETYAKTYGITTVSAKPHVQGLLRDSPKYCEQRDNIGLARLIKKYADNHILCLDLAKRNIGNDKIDYDGLNKSLFEAEQCIKKYTGSPLSPDQKTLCEWGRVRTEFFLTLLINQKQANDYPALVRQAFPTKVDYDGEYLVPQLKAIKAVYRSLLKKINNPIGKALDWLPLVNTGVYESLDTVKIIQEIAMQAYTKERDDVYKS